MSLNGRAITVPTRLRDGAWLALGETLFQVHLPDSEFTRPRAARPPPPGPGKAHGQKSRGDIVTIGRDPRCDHTIDSPLVSREHARLTIGYVPQQDIVHRKIRVSRALYHTARLRLPPDTTGRGAR